MNNSNIYAEQLAANTFNRPGDKRNLSTAYQTTLAVVELIGNEAVNEVSILVELPVQTQIFPEESYVVALTDPGTALTVDIGDKLDPDRYAANMALTVPGKVDFIASGIPAGVVTRHTIGNATRKVILTVKLSTAPTAGAKLMFKLAYKPL